jgi:hypothetical protein
LAIRAVSPEISVNPFGRNDIIDLRAPCPSVDRHPEGPDDATPTTRDEFASKVGLESAVLLSVPTPSPGPMWDIRAGCAMIAALRLARAPAADARKCR